ncbi:MAG: 50S ribosomal protein L4, partial [Thermoprotei archaeon]
MAVFEYVTLVLEESKEVPVLDLEGKVVNKVKLPPIFGLPVRIDVIRRAFHSAHTARIQPKGRDPLAGKRRCGHYWGIGHGLARLPRLWNGRAVFAPNVKGGRRQFAPTPLKRIREEINWKEMKLAILSALAASARREFVETRGHVVPENIEVPVVVVDELEKLERTKQVKEFLTKTGLWADVERAQRRTRIRAGKGKMRGRRYVTPKSV